MKTMIIIATARQIANLDVRALHGDQDISVRQLLPTQGETSPERTWRDAFVDLESRAKDMAIIASNNVPPRFERRTVYEEDFVIVARTGHPFASDPSLRRYCESQHVVVSHGGDPPYGLNLRRNIRNPASPNPTVAIRILGQILLVIVAPDEDSGTEITWLHRRYCRIGRFPVDAAIMPTVELTGRSVLVDQSHLLLHAAVALARTCPWTSGPCPRHRCC